MEENTGNTMVTLLDLAIELLLSVNRGSGGRLSGAEITKIVEDEINWLNDNNLITLPEDIVEE